MKILIPGGCGFMGTNLAIYFAARGHDVFCIDPLRRASATYQVRAICPDIQHPRARIAQYEIEHERAMQFGVDFKPDAILNCAAQSNAISGQREPMVDFESNVRSAVACCEIARKTGAVLIHWSTNKVYPAETINALNSTPEESRYRIDWTCGDLHLAGESGHRTIYGATKLAAESLIEEWSRVFKIPTIINRFSCLAGNYQFGAAEQGWLAYWLMAHLFEQPLRYCGWSGKQVRDVLAADDCCRLVEKQIEALRCPQGWAFNRYNVGGGIGNTLSLREATAICEELTSHCLTIEAGPPRYADQRVYVSDISHVCRQFDWKPLLSPRQILSEMYEWAQKNRKTLAEHYAPQNPVSSRV